MMSPLLIGLACALCAITVQEQPETLIKGPIESGGFGGPVVKLSQAAGQTAVFVGGRGGWIVNHCFVIGGGGYGLVNENINVRPRDHRDEYRLEMGYGGVELEYVHKSRKLAHLSIQALIGGGTAGYRYWDWDTTVASDAFFVAEPALNVEVNISRPFRIAFGGGYRFVSGFDLQDLPEVRDKDLSGITGTLTLKFGSF